MEELDDRSSELHALRRRVAELEQQLDGSSLEAYMRGLFDEFFEGIQLIDAEFRYVYVNETAASQGRRGRDELVGRRLTDVYPGIDATEMFEKLRRCMLDRTPQQMTNFFVYPDGRGAWFDLRFRPVAVGVLILSADVSSAKAAEAELRESREHLAATLECMADGVISGYSGILLNRLPADDPTRGPVGQIQKAGDQAARLTRQLLAFGRQQVMEATVVDLNVIVEETHRMLGMVLGEDIHIAAVCAPELDGVLADAGKLQQVILNLAVNARDAMPEGGRLTIETANVELDDAYADAHVDVKPGPYVMLAVSDTGCGMDAPTQARVFEPFFTTKESGKGTGLGLSTVFGIVKQSGGHIWVYSEPEHGTTFRIYLPVAGASTRPRKAVLEEQELVGEETILVVEDDDTVREIMIDGLEGYGYQVLEAREGAEAIAIAETHPRTIDVLMTDAVMPGLPGRAVAERVAALRPGIRILFVSGYTEDVVVRHGLLDAKIAFLQKPFMAATLARKIRDLLAE